MRLRPDRRAALALIGAALAAPACARAPERAPLPTGRPAGGAGEGARLARRAGLSGRVGFVVADLETGETLDAMNPAEAFAPASTVKAATALYALETLGPARRFRTEALAGGPVAGGRVAGDLALRGGGDPELDSAALAELAGAAAGRAAGVTGRFLVDPGPWPVARRIDGDQPVDAAYNPSVAALNLNFNRVRFRWRRAGGAVETAMQAHAVGASPETRAVAAALEASDCGCPVFTHAMGEEGEVWRVRADMLRGEGSVWLPVRDPVAYAGDVFRTLAAEAGLALPPPEPGRAPFGATPLAAVESRPAAEIAADMMRFSTNLTAEALGLAATAARGERAAGIAASARAMCAWCAERAGFAPDDPEFRLMNHSGLSAESAVSPRRLAALLRAAAGGPLEAMLEERRIDDRGAPAPEGARVLAKTGTMDFVRALAGYAVAPSGRRLVFAYCAGDLERRAATRGMGRRPPGALGWRNRAQGLERALLRSWLERFA